MTKIIIADDHPMLRFGFIQFINKEVDMKVTEECETGEELLSKILDDDFDIVILDIDMPGRNGIDILKEIKKMKPEMPVLILSSFNETRYGVRAIQAGANAYLSKEVKKEILIETLRRIKGGKKFITPQLAEVLADEIDSSSSDKPLHEKLSDRELEIMRHIALGKSVSEIAELLSLSVNTINTYRARVMEKMKMKSNTQLALYALENKLLD
ncbi:MAG: DNA-binding response regulator [Ignavibacteriae bacterium HGW-Ignavibacteriae-3]|nr:MAG: DNA-binding response regulator [Ignavibacteriae bacterium HGW-Ignavibacteriae-3]